MKTTIISFFLVLWFGEVLMGQDKNALSESPRHHEWVDFERDNGSQLKAFVVYPESKEATKSVIVIHENRGLNDWARSFADQLAGYGYLVIAPDIISNTVSGIEKTTDFPDSDTAREAIYALDKEQVTKDLDLVYAYVKNDAASNGKVSVVGFCWGGSQTFRYATSNAGLENAFVFYGTGPKEAADYQNIETPVYGFYGGNDNRVNATVPNSAAIMKESGKTFEYEMYEGAGHAFMRKGAEENEGPNKEAHDKSWKRLLAILK